ncbi:MAG: TonB-dependent receptor [Bacteroidales bacterium]|nr:TonB-dependent receptor [Bacteroidales bacterium]
MKNLYLRVSRKAWLALTLAILAAVPALAQKITVSGVVYEPDGEPAIGVSVTVQDNPTVGVNTNIDGEYRLECEPTATLVVSYVGYETQYVKVDGRTNIDIHLSTQSKALEELVVIGYGAVKKEDATGSVSVIKPDEIEAGLASTAQDMLVGASPGVVVTTDGGSPNGGANIIIRGGASLAASNDPLIVIDGVPIDRNTVTGSSNPLSLVAPDNVESMTILKDASATAIYGSRASNGVIIITTKKGKKGKPQVNFSANLYINTPRKTMSMMDGNEFANFINSYYGEGSTQAAGLGANGTLYNTNWQDEVLRTSVSSDYNLSVGGSVGFLPYRVAVSYTNNNGIIRTSKMDRATASVNLTPTFFDDLLSVNVNFKGAYVNNGYTQDALGTAISFNPTLPVHMNNVFNNWTTYIAGGALATESTPGGSINTLAALNPKSMIDDYKSTSDVWQSVGNIQFDLKMPFLRDLRANLNLGYDYSHGKCTSYNYPFSPAAWSSSHYTSDTSDLVTDGYSSKGYEDQTRYNLLLDFYLNYNHTFDFMNLDATAGYSWQRFKNKGWNKSQVYAPGQSFDGYQRSETYHYSAPLQLLSYFGRVNFVFWDKYLLTATVRWDGTSRFSKDHRWGTFPSVALGWKLLDEEFMKPARTIMNELKIRAGFGVTGQQDLGSNYFAYLPVYNQNTSLGERYPNPLGTGDPVYQFVPGVYNGDLKWEETHTWNVGVDFAFLNNRIAGSIDYYLRKTKDLLTYANFTAGSNLSNTGNLNLGDLENYGIEFNITTRPIVMKDFQWTSSLNVAWNKNKITRLADGADTTTGGVGNGVNVQKHVEGYSAYSFYVYEQVYNEDGTPMEGVFVDRNGDGEITDADKYIYHSKDPKVTLNWQNSFTYKNWDFGFALRANIGNWVYNANEKNNCFISATSAVPLSNLLNNVYLFEQTRTTEMICSDYFVRNASFLRCDNITVGYTWPKLLNNALRLRVYGAVQNPFVITKYKGVDPEVFSGIDSSVYPRPITVTFGLVATF